MKIEKGYTLSQFIYLIAKKDVVDMSAEENLGLIYKYNSLLNKPLIPTMFKGTKAIFKDWSTPDKDCKGYFVWKNRTSVEFEDGVIWFESQDFNDYKSEEIKTIEDLFRVTEGSLEIKNLEI